MTNLDVVKKLIGSVVPVGVSEIDEEAFENLKAMCELTNQLVTEIDNVAYCFKDDKRASVSKMSNFAQKFLTDTLGITNP